jgi:hypothetical protein
MTGIEEEWEAAMTALRDLQSTASRLCGEPAQDNATKQFMRMPSLARTAWEPPLARWTKRNPWDNTMTSRNRQKRSEARQVEKRLARKPKPSKKPRSASFAPANFGRLASEAVEPEGKAHDEDNQ